MKVLFVCTGNLCRSPAAEALGPTDVEFSSAGTIARAGQAMHPDVVAAVHTVAEV